MCFISPTWPSWARWHLQAGRAHLWLPCCLPALQKDRCSLRRGDDDPVKGPLLQDCRQLIPVWAGNGLDKRHLYNPDALLLQCFHEMPVLAPLSREDYFRLLLLVKRALRGSTDPCKSQCNLDHVCLLFRSCSAHLKLSCAGMR